jgi:hypothetical protein
VQGRPGGLGLDWGFWKSLLLLLTFGSGSGLLVLKKKIFFFMWANCWRQEAPTRDLGLSSQEPRAKAKDRTRWLWKITARELKRNSRKSQFANAPGFQTTRRRNALATTSRKPQPRPQWGRGGGVITGLAPALCPSPATHLSLLVAWRAASAL